MVGLLADPKAGATVAGLAAVVAVAAWYFLAPDGHRPMRQEPPSFVLCETDYGESCSRGQPVRWLVDFYKPLQLRAGSILTTGRRPVVLHVGASNFRDDIPEYQPLLAAITEGIGRTPRLVLVEPEQEHRAQLLQRYKDLGLQADDVTVVTTAMNNNCNGSYVQYIFSDRLFDDFAPEGQRKSCRQSLRSWRSFTKARLANAIRGVAEDPTFTSGQGSSGTFNQFHHVIVPMVIRIHKAGNVSEYIEEIPVPCMGAPELMAEADFKMSDVAMMTVDAEGFDIPILTSFIAQASFEPTVMRWEGKLEDAAAEEVLTYFSARGYFMGKNGYSHSKDVIGYRGPPV